MSAHNNWKPFLQEELNKPYYKELTSFLNGELEKEVIYPPQKDWFNSLSISPEEIKVVILGQDPYHGEGQAHGFSFSVPEGMKPPPSLINIYKEIENEFNIKMSKQNGNLLPWVEQGVLLLNSILTVRKMEAASHRNKGWEQFTDKIIESIGQSKQPKVFLLWGSYAKSKANLINKDTHLILTSVHPSPLSAHNGFFGNNHFKEANNYLISKKIQPINWEIN